MVYYDYGRGRRANAHDHCDRCASDHDYSLVNRCDRVNVKNGYDHVRHHHVNARAHVGMHKCQLNLRESQAQIQQIIAHVLPAEIFKTK